MAAKTTITFKLTRLKLVTVSVQLAEPEGHQEINIPLR